MIAQPVLFFFEKPYQLKNRRRLKSFIADLFKKEKIKLEQLNYIFCSDDQLLNINKQFLNHDFLTDVITFPLSDHSQPVQAEIYISIDRVRDNARELDVSVSVELLRVIFHGALHLCGYKDKTKSQIRQIREREDFYLKRYDRLQ